MASERRLAAILAADMFGYSRLMESGEEAVLSRQKTHRRELIDPAIERHRGGIVKTTGDGMIVEFASAHDAVHCALEIQEGMAERERASPPDRKIQYRIGINVGDVVFEAEDLFGDGVNVASRLEALSEPGGVCVSETVFHMLHDRSAAGFRDLGSQRVKNISRAIRVWQWSPSPAEEEPELDDAAQTQRVQFCVAPDGVQLAFASVGQGPPVFKAPNWLNHLEYEWRSPVWGPVFSRLARKHRLVRFDQRGNGLSDWELEEISEEAMISDMESVVEAAGLERFALLGISQGCAFSVNYAARHPEKINCLVLYGGYARGSLKRNSEGQKDLHLAATTMIRRGWGSPNPTYRHFFTELLMPDATAQQKKSFDEFQRISIAPENAARIHEMNAQVEVTELARRIEVPTLVLHCEGDQRVPMEEGRRLAALIPGARFIALEGSNHALIEGSPAFDRFFEEFESFVSEHS